MEDYALNDIVMMKKQHPCGTNRWQIIRVGADIKIQCMGLWAHRDDESL